MRYLDRHAYKTPTDDKHKIEFGAVFDNVDHFKRILHDVMIR